MWLLPSGCLFGENSGYGAMRADLFLSAHGLAPSREAAKKLILDDCVRLSGVAVKKPSEDIPDRTDPGELLILPSEATRYASRGGLKLAAALDAFGISVSGIRALDIGASTGGFTDCLLSRGAAHVTAVDSGHGQMLPRLAADPRVLSLEGINARFLDAKKVGSGFDLAVMDVSFISQTLILPGIPPLLADGGGLVSLIKPQFEVGRADVGKGGIVRSESARRRAADFVCSAAEALGFESVGVIRSPVAGGDGNIEFLAYFLRRG